LPLDVGFIGEIEVAAVGLRFADESGFQVFFSLGAFELHRVNPLEPGNLNVSPG